MNDYDVAIVGGGAAGLSAALVLSRARRRVVVVDAGEPRNAPAAHMQGFLGSDGMPPRELLAAGRREVAGYGGDLIDGRVAGIEPSGTEDGKPLFEVVLETGPSLRARRLIVTTGLRDEVPTSQECASAGVATCCTARTATGTRSAINRSASWVEPPRPCLTRTWSGSGQPTSSSSAAARAPTGGAARTARRARIRVVDTPVTRLVVEADRLTRRGAGDGGGGAPDGGLRAPRIRAARQPADGLGCATEDTGWVRVDATGRTSVPGVWAAGNAVNPRAQVITAAGEGSAAAIAVNNDLVEEDVRVAVAQSRALH